MSLFGVVARLAPKVIGLPAFQRQVPPALKIGTLYGLAVQYSSKVNKLRPNFINTECGFNNSLVKAVIISPNCGEGLARIPFYAGGYDPKHYVNSANTVHGGLQSSLHDLAGCKAVMSQGHHGATRTMVVNFTGSASLGTTKLLEARAKVVDVRDGKAYVESVLKQDEQQISTASICFKIWSQDLTVQTEPMNNENGGNIDSSLSKYSNNMMQK